MSFISKKVFIDIFFIISILIHPIFIPLYLAIWFLFAPSVHIPMAYAMFIPLDIKIKYLLLYALIMIVIPLIILAAARIFKIITHIMIYSVNDRKYFFLVLGVYYWFVFYMFQKMYMKELFNHLILLIAVTDVIVFLSSIITSMNFKISIHTAGTGAITGLFIAFTLIFKDIYLSEIIISIGITTLVMIARTISSSHSFAELISGWLLGVFSSITVFLIAY